jgi:hypothetical protein
VQTEERYYTHSEVQCVCIDVYMCVCMYVYMCICMHVSMYVRMYVCMDIHIYSIRLVCGGRDDSSTVQIRGAFVLRTEPSRKHAFVRNLGTFPSKGGTWDPGPCLARCVYLLATSAV